MVCICMVESWASEMWRLKNVKRIQTFYSNKKHNESACWGFHFKSVMAYLCIYCGHVNELKYISVS